MADEILGVVPQKCSPRVGMGHVQRTLLVAAAVLLSLEESQAFLPRPPLTLTATRGLGAHISRRHAAAPLWRRSTGFRMAKEGREPPREVLEGREGGQLSRREAMLYVVFGSAAAITSATALPAQAKMSMVLLRGLDGFQTIPTQLGFNSLRLKTEALDKKSLNLLNIELADRIETLRTLRQEVMRGNFTCTGKPAAFRAETFQGCLEKPTQRPSWVVWAAPLALIVGGVTTASLVQYELLKRRTANRVVSSSIPELLSYSLENAISTTIWAKPLLLISLMATVIIIGAALFVLDPMSSDNFGDALIVSWSFFTGQKVNAEGPIQNAVAFFISAAGLFANAALIAIIAESVSDKVELLKKGREGVKVVEAGHTLLLGWSDRSIEVIRQVSIGNQQFGGGCIIVLENKYTKEEVEDLISQGFGNPIGVKMRNVLGTDIVVRNADPLLPSELDKVSVADARAVVCLADASHTPEQSDSHMLRQALAIQNSASTIETHIVFEADSRGGAEALHCIAPEITMPILSHRILGSLLVKCALRPSLGFVVCQLASFDGSEPYLCRYPELVGKTFGDVWYRFDGGLPVGIRERGGDIIINPPAKRVISESDDIITIAKDLPSLAFNKNAKKPDNAGGIPKEVCPDPPPKFERVLVCGWRRNVGELFRELDLNMFPGSEIWWLSTAKIVDRAEFWGPAGGLDNAIVRHAVGDASLLSNVSPVREFTFEGDTRESNCVDLENFSTVITLAEGQDALAVRLTIQKAMLQRPAMRVRVSGGQIFPTEVVAEINDLTTQGLLLGMPATGQGTDIMPRVSAAVCALFAQVAMRRENTGIFEALSGRLRLRDACQYAQPNEELTFWELAARVRQRGQILVGYKVPSLGWESAAAGETCLNPPNKDQKITWASGTTLVIVQSSLFVAPPDQS